jgi:hypothetical protein
MSTLLGSFLSMDRSDHERSEGLETHLDIVPCYGNDTRKSRPGLPKQSAMTWTMRRMPQKRFSQ